MTIDDKVHHHYDPLEYGIGFKIMSEIRNFDKRDNEYLMKLFKIAEHGKDDKEKKHALNEYKKYIDERYEDIGDTMYYMYNNLYLCLRG